ASAVRSRVAASSKASASAAARAARTLYSTPRAAPPKGAAAAKWCARSARARPERPAGLSRASPTRRWSSARRIPDSRSYSARRTSSWVKRYASRAEGSSSSIPLWTASSSAARSSGSSSPAAARTMSSSNSDPAVAASSSRSVVTGERRESRRLTTSRTLSGLPISAGGRASRIVPPPSSTAPVSINVRLGVAEGGEQEHARVPGSTGQVTQEKERRGVCPVPVLEDEQCGPITGEAGEQVGHRRVQPVAFGIRIGLDRRRELADPGRQIGEEARELAAVAA